jgi:hypothetical protein
VKARTSDHSAGGSVHLSDEAHDVEIRVRARFAQTIEGDRMVDHIEVAVFQYDGSLAVHMVVP